MRQNRRKNAFTLIEMFTVIAIIAILVALLFPAIKSAMIKTETSKAQTAITGLATAFRAYYTEYGKWPVNGPPGGPATEPFTMKVDGTLVKLLQGQGSLPAVSTAPYQGNPRNIVFLEFKAQDLDGSGQFLDPWKQPYQCTFDINYDNQVQDPFAVVLGPCPNANCVNAGFLVWSAGPGGNNPAVKSW